MAYVNPDRELGMRDYAASRVKRAMILGSADRKGDEIVTADAT